MTLPLAVRPTRVRYLVVLAAMLVAVLLYLERVCLSVAEVFVREDLGLTKGQMDWAFGAFFFAYALGQVPSGWLAQRYGPRVMMTAYMVGWSVFGVAIAFSQDFWTLFVARFLLGLSQAGAYPTAALLVKRWVPASQRGLASGVVAFGGRFGGSVANLTTGMLIVAFVPMGTPATLTDSDKIGFMTVSHIGVFDERPQWVQELDLKIRRDSHLAHSGYIESLNAFIQNPHSLDGIDLGEIAISSDGKAILAKPPTERSQEESERLNRLVIEKAFPGAIRQLHTPGWRPTLFLYGVLGIGVGAIFFAVARSWPHEHPWANRAEIELIEGNQPPASEAGTSAVPFGPLARSRNQWLFSANQFFSNIGWVFLITLLPRFLDERFHVPVDQRGAMVTVVLLVAAFGTLAGGWFTDRLTRTHGRWLGRAIPMGAVKVPCAVMLALCPWLTDPWTVIAALAVMAICQDFGLPAVWAFAQDTGGKQVGAVLGWANMWGNFGAGVAPFVLGLLSRKYGWDAALYTGAFAFVMCGVLGMLASAAVPLFPAKGEPEAD